MGNSQRICCIQRGIVSKERTELYYDDEFQVPIDAKTKASFLSYYESVMQEQRDRASALSCDFTYPKYDMVEKKKV